MVRQRRRDTAPEIALRRELHARGRRFLVDWPLPGLNRRRCDLAFTRRRVVIFVDGCFWHGCPTHGSTPISNQVWWTEKLRRNAERDRDTDHYMRSLGWTVLRFWEHEDARGTANVVEAALETSQTSNGMS
jgi:DNA mismatch endonuclease (patch repair protein)